MFAKSLLAIALVALSVSASPVQLAGTSEASLYERSLVPEFVGLDKRESRGQAASRIALAKKRASKKAKRAAMIEEGNNFIKRAVAEVLSREPVLTKRQLEARDLSRRALRSIRCGNNDRVCARAALPSDLPENGATVCSRVTKRCVIGCRAGFQLVGGACIANTPQCGADTCGTVANGVFFCSGPAGAQECTLACNTQQGFEPVNGACISTRTDPRNCGALNNACPASYNGVGTAICNAGRCQIACPAGSFPRSTQAGNAVYCE